MSDCERRDAGQCPEAGECDGSSECYQKLKYRCAELDKQRSALEAELGRIRAGMGDDYGDDLVVLLQHLKDENASLRAVLPPASQLREYADGMHPARWILDHELRDFLRSWASAIEAALAPEQPKPSRPKIVCLCGSTRFYDAFQQANYAETMAGRIVLSVGHYPNSDGQHGEKIGATAEEKRKLDELHMRKIDLADEVLILNVGGYIGESTRRELDYARANGKPVRFLEPEKARE